MKCTKSKSDRESTIKHRVVVNRYIGVCYCILVEPCSDDVKLLYGLIDKANLSVILMVLVASTGYNGNDIFSSI